MKQKLDGKKFAILATDGFEESELAEPMQAIKDAGGTAEIISLESGSIRSWHNGDWGKPFTVDKTVEAANPEDYDGLLLPGGVMNPDKLRADEKAVNFVKSFFKAETQRPAAAICHGPWMLAEAGVLKGRTVTSFKSIKTDLENAGATWRDKEVVVDQGLVTSRHPDDLPAFKRNMVEEFCEGRHKLSA